MPHHFFSSSTSLSLKTPFADVQSEKRGLQRRVSNRRKITEKEFDAAVNKIEMGGEYDYKNICDSTFLLFKITSIRRKQSIDFLYIFMLSHKLLQDHKIHQHFNHLL